MRRPVRFNLVPLARVQRAAMSPLAAPQARNSIRSGRYPLAKRAACRIPQKRLRMLLTWGQRMGGPMPAGPARSAVRAARPPCLVRIVTIPTPRPKDTGSLLSPARSNSSLPGTTSAPSGIKSTATRSNAGDSRVVPRLSQRFTCGSMSLRLLSIGAATTACSSRSPMRPISIRRSSPDGGTAIWCAMARGS